MRVHAAPKSSGRSNHTFVERNRPGGHSCIYTFGPSREKEVRAKSIPQEPDNFITNVDAAFMEQVLNIPKGKWKSDGQHHSQSYDLGARLKIAKRAALCHLEKLGRRPARLKTVFSDTTKSMLGKER